MDRVLHTWRRDRPDRTFRRRLPRDLPLVLADPDWLVRVLHELVDNAVKFSDDPVLVTAATTDDHVRVEIRDKGVGIPETMLEEVRGDFRQADASSTRHYGGLGLGLAIVERILERQDGALELTSSMGQGTHVAVVLPAADSEP